MQNDKKNGDDLTLTSKSKIDLARLPPCFSNLLPHIYRVSHRLAFYKPADEPFVKSPNLYDDKQGWLKKQHNLYEPICQVGPILPSALVDIVDSVEQEREQEVFIELDDLDTCIEGKENADFSTD